MTSLALSDTLVLAKRSDSCAVLLRFLVTFDTSCPVHSILLDRPTNYIVANTNANAMPDHHSMCDQAKAHNRLHPTGDLNNEVHPLFARENFLGNTDFDVFLPSLRLLTRIIDTPQVRHYFFVAWFGRNERIGMQDSRGRHLEAYHSDRSVTNLSPGDIAAVHTKLSALAKMVKFQVTDHFGTKKNGWCSPIHPPSVPGLSRPSGAPPTDPDGFPGLSSYIFIAKARYNAINTPVSPTRSAQSYLHDCFSVAMTLLHELVHAAHFAAMGSRQEDFFEDSVVAEAGFEIQTRFLGAVYAGRTGTLDEWPNRWILGTYNNRLACRSIDSVAQAMLTMRVPEHFVSAMFHGWFWDWADRYGPKAFVVELIERHIRRAIAAKTHVCVPRSIADLYRDGNGRSDTQHQHPENRTARQTVEMRERVERLEAWAAGTPSISPVNAEPEIAGSSEDKHWRVVMESNADGLGNAEDEEDGGVLLQSDCDKRRG